MSSRKIGFTSKNKHGGYFHNGDAYPHEKKMEVVRTFLDLYKSTYPLRPTFTVLAKKCKVATSTARKYINELLEMGKISDPKMKSILAKEGSTGHNLQQLLTFEEEQFLLALRAQDSTTPLAVYRQLLLEVYEKEVSVLYLHNWWNY